MIVYIVSGKGGTGKTTIAVSLALSLSNVQFLDCDVEEPNAHIFLKPELYKQEKCYIPIPEIDESKCDFCGLCSRVCAYNALAVITPEKDRKGHVLVFDQLCHGCGACSFLCPRKAITEVNKEIGVIESGHAEEIEFAHGRLNIGAAMAPPIIRKLKRAINPNKTVVIDAPPGTSCPVVTTLTGSDFAILVTEPTPFGLNDLILMVEVIRKLKIPFGIIINRADVGDDKVRKYCNEQKIPILLEIPFKREIALAYSKGDALVTALPEYKKIFSDIFLNI